MLVGVRLQSWLPLSRLEIVVAAEIVLEKVMKDHTVSEAILLLAQF